MMSISRCPHCRIKLGNFPYADECPGCHEELKHNITPLTSPEQKELRSNSWLVSSFFASGICGEATKRDAAGRAGG